MSPIHLSTNHIFLGVLSLWPYNATAVLICKYSSTAFEVSLQHIRIKNMTRMALEKRVPQPLFLTNLPLRIYAIIDVPTKVALVQMIPPNPKCRNYSSATLPAISLYNNTHEPMVVRGLLKFFFEKHFCCTLIPGLICKDKTKKA